MIGKKEKVANGKENGHGNADHRKTAVHLPDGVEGIHNLNPSLRGFKHKERNVGGQNRPQLFAVGCQPAAHRPPPADVIPVIEQVLADEDDPEGEQ